MNLRSLIFVVDPSIREAKYVDQMLFSGDPGKPVQMKIKI